MKQFSLPIETLIYPNNKYPYKLLLDVTIRATGITGYDIKTNYIALNDEGDLTIFSGYSWDGASGAVDTLSAVLMSLSHDAFYQLLRMGLIPYEERKRVDCFSLISVARANGMSCFRSFYIYTAVRLFGGRFAKMGKV